MLHFRRGNVVFKDKPDKIFKVWIYHSQAGGYLPREFKEAHVESPQNIPKFVKEAQKLAASRDFVF